MMMIDLFIPSKDRASQLDLLIRSMSKNAPVFRPLILWKGSDEEYRQGYKKLQEKRIYRPCMFLEETNLMGDFHEMLSESKNSLVCICTDDTVFYRKANLAKNDLELMFKDESLSCFSFRL